MEEKKKAAALLSRKYQKARENFNELNKNRLWLRKNGENQHSYSY